MSSNKTKRQRRRGVMPGFPVEGAFASMEAVNSYLRGEFITCLRCGKEYRSIAAHLLAIHEMTGDQYREMYGIPYGVPLCATATSAKHSEFQRAQHAANPDVLVERVAQARTAPKPKTRVSAHMRRTALANLKEHTQPRRPLVDAGDGEMLSHTAAREKNTAPFGSEEHRAKLREKATARILAGINPLASWWKGKKQSPEHRDKRIAAALQAKKAKKERGE